MSTPVGAVGAAGASKLVGATGASKLVGAATVFSCPQTCARPPRTKISSGVLAVESVTC